MTPEQSRPSLIAQFMQVLRPQAGQTGAASREPSGSGLQPDPGAYETSPIALPDQETYRIRLSSESYRHLSVWLLAGLVAGLALMLLALPSRALAQPPLPHQYIDEYVGPATCEACHGDVTGDVTHSVHYTWAEKLDHYSPIAGSTARINWLGMLNEKLNIPGGCGRCHIGDGSMPKAPEDITPADKAGIDCLICHSPVYDTSLRFPVQNADGTWTLTQDRGVMTARQAQRPTAENCLLCHQNVGGGAMLKRGVDFAPVADKHGEASKGDVHADAGMACVDCHGSEDHKVRGFGPDLWSRDLPDQRLLCDECHTAAPHQNAILNQHAVRVDCRACHVLGTGGLVSRNWTAAPTYDPVTELYSPIDQVRAPNSVTPVYKWHNGQPAKPGEPWPGSRSDLDSRIQPFKEFTATVPVDAQSGQPIPLKLDIYYTTGDVDRSVEAGARESGMDYSGQWTSKVITSYLQISHGVVGKEDALTCQNCHVPDGRIDFANMGYVDDEVDVYQTISSAAAGPRQPLQLQVVIPAAQPLPTPVSLSGDVQATRGVGIRIPWNPWLALLLGVIIVVVAFLWLRRQRPEPPANQA